MDIVSSIIQMPREQEPGIVDAEAEDHVQVVGSLVGLLASLGHGTLLLPQ